MNIFLISLLILIVIIYSIQIIFSLLRIFDHLFRSKKELIISLIPLYEPIRAIIKEIMFLP